MALYIKNTFLILYLAVYFLLGYDWHSSHFSTERMSINL